MSNGDLDEILDSGSRELSASEPVPSSPFAQALAEERKAKSRPTHLKVDSVDLAADDDDDSIMSSKL